MRYRTSGLDLIRNDKYPIRNAIVNMFVDIGQQSHPNCSTKVSALDEFDLGAAIFSRKYRLEAEFAKAASCGLSMAERDQSSYGMYDIIM
jgi:hypothetical protein